MANKFARNIEDAELAQDVVLPANTNELYSDDIDLGAEPFKGENYELEVSIPAIAVADLPNAKVLTIKVYGGASAAPTTQIEVSKTVTGATAVDPSLPVAFRFRLASDVARVIRVGFKNDGGDQSDYSAHVALKF